MINKAEFRFKVMTERNRSISPTDERVTSSRESDVQARLIGERAISTSDTVDVDACVC